MNRGLTRRPIRTDPAHYVKPLKTLGEQGGRHGLIFRKAQNRIQDPAKLRRLIVELIDQEHWIGMSADVKGDAYEGLLLGKTSERH